MKNRHAAILILITCTFAAFTLGFLAGRSTAPGDIIITRAVEPAEIRIEVPAPLQSTAAAIPSSGTAPTDPTEVSTLPAETSVSGLININTATPEQLDTLPGIGPVLAQRIIDYREENGPFTDLGQLILVKGIGEKRLAEILPLITIE